MPRFRAPATSALIALLSLALPVHAAPEPIVFDFEDGLQGWELGGSAQRVQTQLLGGQWAIFGDGLADGGTRIFIDIDLSGIHAVTVEQLFVAGDENGLFFFVENPTSVIVLFFSEVEPGNPSIRIADVSSLQGVGRYGIWWGRHTAPQFPDPLVAFIDNIIFHPVPEPTSFFLVAFGVIGVAVLRWRRRARSVIGTLALLLFFSPPTAAAAPEPIVFDFEDGLQGWELGGSANRVQTGLVGDSWAIFGDGSIEGGAVIFIEADLTNIGSISLEQFFIAGDEGGLGLFLQSGSVATKNLIPFEVIEPGNPSLRVASVSSVFTGTGLVAIQWSRPSFLPGNGTGLPFPTLVAFIDNITFHPVPEPSSWLLLSLGIAGVVMIRRKVASRA